MLSDPHYVVRYSLLDDDFRYGVSALEVMVDTVAFHEQTMRPNADGHLFCFALRPGQ